MVLECPTDLFLSTARASENTVKITENVVKFPKTNFNLATGMLRECLWQQILDWK